jgi:mRNA-degrading endonuclease HigB of HigAB toxin-antitoxin module
LRLVGRHHLDDLISESSDLSKWVGSWTAELRDAHWKRPADVAGQFPSVILVSDGRYVFPIPPGHSGVAVRFQFARGVALISSVEKIT